jgi:hypothetical protein
MCNAHGGFIFYDVISVDAGRKNVRGAPNEEGEEEAERRIGYRGTNLYESLYLLNTCRS